MSSGGSASNLVSKMTRHKSANKLVIVVSHERSGTHFLMNTIDKCQSVYTSDWIDFDPMVSVTSNVNFYHSDSLQQLCNELQRFRCNNIVKTHLHFDFFKDIDTSGILFFYIYRDPFSTLASYWNYIRNVSWKEGMKTEKLIDFISSEPCGMQLRYQSRQEKTVFNRWQSHVDSWLLAAKTAENIHIFKYQELNANYESQATRICGILNLPVISIEPPDKNDYLKFGVSQKPTENDEIESKEYIDKNCKVIL